jgi:hypothetical protein
MARGDVATLDALGLSFSEEGLGAAIRGGGPLARVHILSNEFEAQFLADALHGERIDVVVQSYRELAFDSIFIPQRGWGCLITRLEDATRAVSIIEQALVALGEPSRGA